MVRFSYSNKDTKDKEEKRVGRRETAPILGVTRHVYNHASPQESTVA